MEPRSELAALEGLAKSKTGLNRSVCQCDVCAYLRVRHVLNHGGVDTLLKAAENAAGALGSMTNPTKRVSDAYAALVTALEEEKKR
jgi:hypothetical protein